MTRLGQTRRTFLKTASLASVAVSLPAVLRSAKTPVNDRLRIALIGVGGRGKVALNGLVDEQCVAFCDVDEKRGKADVLADKATRPILEKFNDAAWFQDYRIMFERMADNVSRVD